MVPKRFPRFSVLAALSLAVLFPACKSERNTTIYQQVPASTGGFPGTPMYQTSLASDGMAFSESGIHFKALRRFDSGRGETLFLYEATLATGLGTVLFASHFDGQAFTPPVQLRGRNQDPGDSSRLDQAFVAFLFPGNARDGDAVIGFMRNDLDDGGGNTSVDANVRLYFSYFDRTYRNVDAKPGDESVRHGFETDCPPLDLTDDDYAGADVAMAGFLSGGTIGPCEFMALPGVEKRFRQGDPTDFLAFFWVQAAPGSPPAPIRLHYATFDLGDTNVGNQFGATAEVGLDAGAAATDTVLADLVNTLDNVLFLLKSDGTDTSLLAAVFDSSTGAFTLNAYAISPTGANTDTAEVPGVDALFGAEAGLSRVVGVFRFTGGTIANEVSLFGFQIDPANPAAAFSAASDLVELDAGSGSGSPYDVLASSVTRKAVLNRTGEWILVPWRQNRSASNAFAALWVNIIQAPRDASPPAITAAVSGASRVDQVGAAGSAVEDFQIQAEVDYQGIQSDRNVINLAWHRDSGAGTDTLCFNSITVTLGPPPSVALGSEGALLPFNDLTLAMADILLMDGGGAGGLAGAPIFYYLKDARASAPTSIRAYQYRSGAVELEVGSLAGGTGGTYHPREAKEIRVMTAPRNADVAGHPDWAGNVHHVFITEYRYLDTAGSEALRHRLFDKHSTATAGGDRFLPVADGMTPPTTLDTGIDLTPTWMGAGFAGETVGLFFMQGDHIWYGEFNPASRLWPSPPALVDDRWPEPVHVQGVLFPFLRDNPDDLHGAAVYWGKNFSTAITLDRLFIRVRY